MRTLVAASASARSSASDAMREIFTPRSGLELVARDRGPALDVHHLRADAEAPQRVLEDVRAIGVVDDLARRHVEEREVRQAVGAGSLRRRRAASALDARSAAADGLGLRLDLELDRGFARSRLDDRLGGTLLHRHGEGLAQRCGRAAAQRGSTGGRRKPPKNTMTRPISCFMLALVSHSVSESSGEAEQNPRAGVAEERVQRPPDVRADRAAARYATRAEHRVDDEEVRERAAAKAGDHARHVYL